MSREREAGNRQGIWRWRDYVGLKAGGAAYGTRRDGAILRASGEVADNWSAAIAALAGNLTRCDLQVTWVDPGLDDDAAVMRLWHGRLPEAQRGRPPGRSLIWNEHGGQTIYAGKRTSDQFGRIYAKHREQPQSYPPGAVRAEIEVKGAISKGLRERIALGSLGPDQVVALAGRWYRRRGLTLPLSGREAIEVETAPRTPTDAARTLRWLAGQVAPGVTRSVDWCGLWPTLTALGLAPAVQRLLSNPPQSRCACASGAPVIGGTTT